jgi:hypothetical protein
VGFLLGGIMSITPLLRAPAQERAITEVQAFVAECEAAIERATKVAIDILPWPAPSNELPHNYLAHQAFLAITTPYHQRLVHLRNEPSFTENYEIAVEESVRFNLPHRLIGGIGKHPEFLRWAGDVARCKAVRSMPIFQEQPIEPPSMQP